MFLNDEFGDWKLVGRPWELLQEMEDVYDALFGKKKIHVEHVQSKLFFLLYSAPAIGGFVAVSQMLKSYGNCVRIGD
jgi:hypothetical protein